MVFAQGHDEECYRQTRGDNRMNDLELQQYLFDLQGYLVIENALSSKAVATLNQIIDEQDLPPPGKSPRFGSAPTLESSLTAATLTACLTLAGYLRAPLVGLTIQPDIDFAFQLRFNQLTGS